MDDSSEKLAQNEDIKDFYLGLTDKGGKKSFRDVKHYSAENDGSPEKFAALLDKHFSFPKGRFVMKKRLALVVTLIFFVGVMLVSCAGMEVKPTESTFKAPAVKLNSIQVSMYEGFWHYEKVHRKEVKPLQEAGLLRSALILFLKSPTPMIFQFSMNPLASISTLRITNCGLSTTLILCGYLLERPTQRCSLSH